MILESNINKLNEYTISTNYEQYILDIHKEKDFNERYVELTYDSNKDDDNYKKDIIENCLSYQKSIYKHYLNYEKVKTYLNVK